MKGNEKCLNLDNFWPLQNISSFTACCEHYLLMPVMGDAVTQDVHDYRATQILFLIAKGALSSPFHPHLFFFLVSIKRNTVVVEKKETAVSMRDHIAAGSVDGREEEDDGLTGCRYSRDSSLP